MVETVQKEEQQRKSEDNSGMWYFTAEAFFGIVVLVVSFGMISGGDWEHPGWAMLAGAKIFIPGLAAVVIGIIGMIFSAIKRRLNR